MRVQGRRAYEVARAGERPTLSAREVDIQRLDLVAWDATDPARPTATVEIACSAGTYVRAIARDLGEALGCGAYLVALTRSRSGPFTHDQAHAPDAIRAAFAAGNGAGLLLPADAGLDDFPSVDLDGDDLQALLRGQVVRAPAGGGAEARPVAQGRPLPRPRRRRPPGGHRAARGRAAPPGEGARRAGAADLTMQRHASLEALPPDIAMVATVGVFDGVHRGHVALIGSLVREARRRSAQAVVVTFDPHPAAVLRGVAPELLCDPEERDARLADLGVDHLVVERFDAALAGQSAEAFVGRLEAGRQLVALMMTDASAFGRGRGGTLASMRVLGAAEGFAVIEIAQRRTGGDVISSSRIRAAVGAGRLAEAARLLGRPYAVTGTVVRGDGRGRTLGFPTANFAFDEPVALPPDGIYAVRVSWGGGPTPPARRADGVASLGVRPTFGRRRARAGGLPARHRRGPLRPSPAGRLRAPPARRATVLERGGPHRADAARRGPGSPHAGRQRAVTGRVCRFRVRLLDCAGYKNGRRSSEDRVPLARETKEAVITDFATKDGDTGSPEVQIALLTERIKELTGHLRALPQGQSFAPRPPQARRPAPPPSRVPDDARTTRATAPSSDGSDSAASAPPRRRTAGTKPGVQPPRAPTAESRPTRHARVRPPRPMED